MNGPCSLLHAAHLAGAWPAHRRFLRALEDPEDAQRTRLQAILRGLEGLPRWHQLDRHTSYEDFQAQVPPHRYDDLAHALDDQRRTGLPLIAPPSKRWQPTSGSTSRRKWIPYPPGFLAELDAAAGPWLFDLARRHPGAFQGRHYWSLSWLPEELRTQGADADDLSLLPAWKRWALSQVMTVPPETARLGSNDEALFATTTWLAATPELSLMSVWSPTFALELLQGLSRQRLGIAEVLRAGRWSLACPAPRRHRSAALLAQWDGTLDPAFFRELWPDLRLVSAWDSAGSAHHARRLEALLPQAILQGKGLWATEGVVSIPFAGTLPLALNSHFLEFRCLSTQRILPAWQLEEGQLLQPLLTTSGGLLRYELDDRVVVTGHCRRTPCIAFRGRLGGTDLVGEKLDRSAVGIVLDVLWKDREVRPVTLFAVNGNQPFYCLLAEGLPDAATALQQELEERLCAFHHYRLARELGQLKCAQVLCVRNAAAWLAEKAKRQGRGAGEWKIEPLEAWELALAPEERFQD
jgi:hypothetical protein